MNVPLPAGTRATCQAGVDKVWLPRLNEFEPQMIFVSAGFDAHREDGPRQMAGEAEYTYTRASEEVAERHAGDASVSSLGRIQPQCVGAAVSVRTEALARL